MNGAICNLPVGTQSQTLPGLLGQMSTELVATGGGPQIVTANLVQVATLLTQGLADGVWPNGVTHPIGVSSVLIAPPGSGKSAVFNLLNQPIVRAATSVECAADFYLTDTTREAIISALVEWPYRSLASDEGAGLVDLVTASNSAQASIVRLLDGNPIAHARVGAGRKSLHGHRFNVFLCIQPDVYKSSPALHVKPGGVGIMNRFQYYQSMGWMYGQNPGSVSLSEDCMRSYGRRIEQLIADNIKQAGSQEGRPLVRCSPGGEMRIQSFEQQVMGQFATNALLKEYIGRSAQRVRQVAGALHVFEYGPTGEIGAEAIECAINIEWQSIFAVNALTYTPPKLTDAQILSNALLGFNRYSNRVEICNTELMDSSINIGLSESQIKRALAELGKLNQVWWIRTVRGRRVLVFSGLVSTASSCWASQPNPLGWI